MRLKSQDLSYKLLLCFATLDAALYSTTISDIIKAPFHKITLILILVLSLTCLFEKKYTRKYFISNVLIILFGIVSYVISGNTDIFVSVLIVSLAWEVDIEDILKIIFSIRLIVFLTTILLAICGILEMGTIALTSAEKSVMFGYGHANTFAGNAGLLIFLMFAICRKRLRLLHFMIALFAEIFVFYFSRSRTSLMLVAGLIIALLLSAKIKKRVLLCISKGFLCVLLLFLFLTIVFAIQGMCKNFVNVIDKLMNGRILLSVMNLKYYPVTILGQRVDLSLIAADHSYYVLDNGYVYVLIHYGVVGLIVITGMAQKAILECVKNKEEILVIICMLILCWMAYEGMMISTTSNFTLLFSVASLNRKGCVKSQKEKLNDT